MPAAAAFPYVLDPCVVLRCMLQAKGHDANVGRVERGEKGRPMSVDVVGPRGRTVVQKVEYKDGRGVNTCRQTSAAKRVMQT